MEEAITKIRVLIADDIPETRENLRKLLYFEPTSRSSATASNGREAIEQAKRLLPDIVLMDINMPDMDGISASQEIGRVAPACQVIMMSVQSEADYLQAFDAGRGDGLSDQALYQRRTEQQHPSRVRDGCQPARGHAGPAGRRRGAPAEPRSTIAWSIIGGQAAADLQPQGRDRLQYSGHQPGHRPGTKSHPKRWRWWMPTSSLAM